MPTSRLRDSKFAKLCSREIPLVLCKTKLLPSDKGATELRRAAAFEIPGDSNYCDSNTQLTVFISLLYFRLVTLCLITTFSKLVAAHAPS